MGRAKGVVHRMSAFASQGWWVWAQLLALLGLSGARVTIDTAGGQKKSAGEPGVEPTPGTELGAPKGQTLQKYPLPTIESGVER